MQRKFKRCIILDPCLGALEGHWSSYINHLIKAINSAGIKNILIFSNVKQKDNLLINIKATPLFRNLIYCKEEERESYSQSFFEDLCNLKVNINEDDLIICPSVYPCFLQALISWINHLKFEPHSAVLLQLGDGINFFAQEKKIFLDDYHIGAYRNINLALDLEKEKLSNVLFFSPSLMLSSMLTSLLGCNVYELPMIQKNVTFSNKKNKNLKIGIFGHTSIEKGAFYIQEIIDFILKSNKKISFNFHLMTNNDTESVEQSFRYPQDRVSILKGWLSEEKLNSFIDDTDIVILPYLASRYRFMPSAIFSQSFSMGKVIVAPQNTTIHRDLIKFRGGYEVFDDFTALSIINATERAIKNYSTLRKRSELARDSFRTDGLYHNYINLLTSSFGEK